MSVLPDQLRERTVLQRVREVSAFDARQVVQPVAVLQVSIWVRKTYSKVEPSTPPYRLIFSARPPIQKSTLSRPVIEPVPHCAGARSSRDEAAWIGLVVVTAGHHGCSGSCRRRRCEGRAAESLPLVDQRLCGAARLRGAPWSAAVMRAAGAVGGDEVDQRLGVLQELAKSFQLS